MKTLTFYRAEYRQFRQSSEWLATRDEAINFVMKKPADFKQSHPWEIASLTIIVPEDWDSETVLTSINTIKYMEA